VPCLHGPPDIEPFGECKPFLPHVLATIPLTLPEQPLETPVATGTAPIERYARYAIFYSGAKTQERAYSNSAQYL
jgi:hypothetical protein